MTTRVWLVEWLGVTAYISAASRSKAKMRAMRSAQDANMWEPGESLKGLRCVVAPYVPADAVVMDGEIR
jgi:hypothetical protein